MSRWLLKLKPLLSYLLLVAALWITNELVLSQVEKMGCPIFPLHLMRVSDAFLLALPIVLVPRRWMAAGWLAVVEVYYVANIWYYRNFGTFIPMSQLLRFSDLNGLGSSILESMRWSDLWLPLPALVWGVWFWWSRDRVGLRWRLLVAGISLIFIAVCVTSTWTRYDKEHEYNPRKLFPSKFSWAYRHYGLLDYWVVQLQTRQRCSEEELAWVDAWLEAQPEGVEVPASALGKNLIIIVVESLSSWEIGLDIWGHEVTPCLNRLVADTANLYLPGCLTQVNYGRSSDCHLMLETGLLPMAHGATALLCSKNLYMSLPKALKERGYGSYCYVCDDKAEWWLQAENYASYGFDRLEDRLGFIRGRRNLDSTEQFLFPRVLQALRQLPEPFYAKAVTMSMHDARPMLHYRTPLQDYAYPEKAIEHLLVRTNYTDYHLGMFLDSLRACGLYDRSVIVITGDHYKVPLDEWDERPQRLPSDMNVPLIVLNPPSKPVGCDHVCGQIDLYPTLLDMMGVGDYPWRGLGCSLYDPAHPGCATRHTGEVEGDTTRAEVLRRQGEAWRVSDIILRGDYFRKRMKNEENQ